MFLSKGGLGPCWVLADKTQKDGSGVNEIPANSVYCLMVNMEQ